MSALCNRVSGRASPLCDGAKSRLLAHPAARSHSALAVHLPAWTNWTVEIRFKNAKKTYIVDNPLEMRTTSSNFFVKLNKNETKCQYRLSNQYELKLCTLYAFLLVTIIVFVTPWIRNNRIFSWQTVGFRLISEILFQRRDDTPDTFPGHPLFLKGT
jgi:hypothetical protein